MNDPVHEIKSKLSIEDVVAPYVTLKKAGKYLKALCPFHQEKSASFYVSPERQIAYCFSCQKGGDHFQFIQDIEGLDFRGALELLADKASVELPKHSGGPKVSKDLKDRLKAVNQEASNFFVHQLWNTDAGAKVLEYVKNRGLEPATLRDFQVGFAPDSKDQLYRHLLEKKHEKADVLEAQLAVSKDSTSTQIADRFHLRLMFPISDVQGNVVAFGGRALKRGDMPKYLNSAEYVLYKKGSILYNLNRAKSSIREKDLAICVEGYFDVMASDQAGVPNVVASSGTALTEDQFKLLKRYSKKVALAFDSDSAGQEALLRAVMTAQALDLELFVIVIPEGKDTADTVKEDPKKWVEAVAQAVPYLEHYSKTWQQVHDLGTSSGKRDYTDAFLALLKGVQHPVERDHYLKELSKSVGTPIDLLYDYLNQVKTRKTPLQGKKVQGIRKNKQERLFDYFLALLLAYPAAFFEIWERFKDYQKFLVSAQNLKLVKPMHKLEAAAFQAFYDNFESFLDKKEYEVNASSVYKAVKDHYNLHANIDEAFYSSVEGADRLRKMAFEAEVNNVDSKLVQQEFEKLITLLYFEHTS